MNLNKNQPNHLNNLRSTLHLSLSMMDDWTTHEVAVEIVENVIEAYCIMIGQAKPDFIKQFPFIERELLEYVHEKKFVTTQEGKLITKDDENSVRQKRRKMDDLKRFLSWNHWEAYKEHLLKTKEDMTPEVIDNIDTDTDNIVMNMPVPKEEKEFFVKGLVVGNVQSGKTLNYSGVINKAIDIGYDIIIVLSGVPANLRNQTQRRMEIDVVGVDSLTGHTIGIGNCFSKPSNVEMYTKQDIIKEELAPEDENNLENNLRDVGGDFNLNRVSHLPVYRGNKQIVIVSKKHGHVLSAIKAWLESLPLMNKETGKLEKLSLLLLNDESDNATINNHRDKGERSTINGLVRDILGLFNKRVVCGYTATPFADIYSDPREKDNLFPSDFMYLLKPPSTYMGPFEFFGVNYKGESVPRMPLVRYTERTDSSSSHFMEDDTLHNWDYESNGLNPSLAEAINSFILSGAIRILRGQGKKHHSMMLHTSVSVALHEVVKNAVQDYIDELKNAQKMPTVPISGKVLRTFGLPTM
ncbi:Z1 domain-containing protein [Bacillus toyonensis]